MLPSILCSYPRLCPRLGSKCCPHHQCRVLLCLTCRCDASTAPKPSVSALEGPGPHTRAVAPSSTAVPLAARAAHGLPSSPPVPTPRPARAPVLWEDTLHPWGGLDAADDPLLERNQRIPQETNTMRVQLDLVLCVSHRDTSPRPVDQGWVRTHAQSMDIRDSSLQKGCGVGWASGDSSTH